WRFSTSEKSPSIPGNSVVAINATSNDVGAPLGVGTTPGAVAAGKGSVWVLNADDRTVSRIDPATGQVTPPKALTGEGTPAAIALGGRSAWVVDAGPAITRIDGGAVVKQRIAVPAISLSSLVVSDGAAWAVDPYGGVLYRVELEGRNVVTTVPVGQGAESVAAGPGAIWVANPVAG